MTDTAKMVIIGSGPAGYTAALYAARANLEPVVYEGFFEGLAGGQLMTTTDVENYPGFPDGITGPELMGNFRKQAERFGAKYILDDVKEVDFTKHPFTVVGKKAEVKALSVIVATGATARRLDIPGAGEGEFWQKGVTACAVCDGASPIFRDKKLYVIGGGDSACEEAIFLTKYASKVFLVHRRDELRASKIMAERVINHPKIEVLWDSVLEKIDGENIVGSVSIKNVKTGEVKEQEAAGVFFAIGHDPNTKFIKGQIDLDDKGFIKVVDGVAETNIPGVFAAGDVQDPEIQQAVYAAGTGAAAAIKAERWLSEKGHLD